MHELVTVAIPTLDAGPRFTVSLEAVAAQRVAAEIELLVCDSSSSDGTAAIARRHGARVVEIPRREFSHGATRNLLMELARGSHVAFLTQDSVPAADDWLATLLSGFSLAEDVGLVYGPYRPQPGASVSVRRELAAWFASLSPDGAPRIDTLAQDRRDQPAAAFLGALGFFTDANGCVSRAAWERVPFRPVAHTEDHLLAQDMLRAGFAKVYLPDAAVVHSHEYSPAQWLRRSFDEARANQDVYGWVPAARWRDAARNLRGNVGADVRLASGEGQAAAPALAASFLHHAARTAGTMLGARAARVPGAVAAALSLEGRR
jgi:glycosyltransferase involved in cell wall biosynthesis